MNKEKLKNIFLYYKEKKYAEANYAYGFVDGDFTLFYPDGSKVLTLTYKDNDVIKSQNFNYKLQKSGIPEFDSLDFSTYLMNCGARIPTRIAMIAMTMISSTSEKPLLFFFLHFSILFNIVSSPFSFA